MLNQSDDKLKQSFSWIKDYKPFQELDDDEISQISSIFIKVQFNPGDVVIKEGDMADSAYLVEEGELTLSMVGRITKHFKKGDFFGEVGLIDELPRLGTIVAEEMTTLLKINNFHLKDETKVPPKISAKIYRGLSRLVTTYIRQGDSFYREMDVLLVQDGGCAPGYNSVTAFITEYLEKEKRKVFIAAEGFKSIVSNKTIDYRCLILDFDEYQQLEHIPGLIFSPTLRESRGASFRAERFPEFKDHENQEIAAKNIMERKVKVLIGIGGNGTFGGIRDLSKLLNPDIQTFFIPVTIDSDIFGTECIGENTGVEVGAEKIRCYMADARTHRRCYIIEMMGRDGGFHALHSCLGAGAHLAVLPNSSLDILKIAQSMENHSGIVIVVAEGYKAKERKKNNFSGNAAEFFRDELLDQNIKFNQRIICESFSRDIRGASPNNLDIMLSQRMARTLTSLVINNHSGHMPAVLSGKEYSIPFDEIKTDNSVQSNLAVLADRLSKKS
jgi:6-phosphofructokinase 1